MDANNRRTALWYELTQGNYYAVLGVSPKATSDEIKTAYHCAVMKCHPDLNNNSEESHRNFLKIKKIYDILSNPTLRAKYDQELARKWSAYLDTSQQPLSSYKSRRKSNSQTSPLSLLIGIGMLVGIIWLVNTCNSNNSSDRDFSNTLPQNIQSSTQTTRQGEELSTTLIPTKSSQATTTYRTAISLSTGDKPYISTYGTGRYDSQSLSFVEVKNGALTDAVVMLYDVSNNRIIRHAYIQAGATYKLSKLPSGVYDLRVYSGNNWNSGKYNGVNFPKGGFDTSESYSRCRPVDYLNMKHITSNDGISYPTYSVALYEIRNGNLDMKEVSANEFFI